LAQRLSQTILIFALISWLALPAAGAEDVPVGAASPESAQVPTAVIAPTDANAAAPVDPADDPWLAEQGPAVPTPVEVSREQVLARWQDASGTPEAKARAVRRVRLELGLGDLLAPAVALLRDASEEEPEIYA
jgi:hypothetical protein